MSGDIIKLMMVGGLQKERESWQDLLEKKHPGEFEVFLTDSGKEALSISKNSEPACLILDFCLFDLDALQLIELFIAQHPPPSVPIITLADPNQRELAYASLEAGASHCIVKEKITAASLHRVISDTIKNAALPEKDRKKQTKIAGLNEPLVENETENPAQPAATQPSINETNEATTSTSEDKPANLEDDLDIDLDSALEIKNPTPAPSAGKASSANATYTPPSVEKRTPPPSSPPETKQTRDLNKISSTMSSTTLDGAPQEAQCDPVTGLPNHVFFKSALEQSISQAERYSRRIALLLFDLHEFEQVTEIHGQKNANALIKDLAERLKQGIRGHDVMARLNSLGVGEFAIILNEITDFHDAATIAKRLLSIIKEPYSIDEQTTQLNASIGIACYPIDSHSVIDFHKNAVLAMYYAKQNDGEIYYFNEELNRQNKRRMDIENDLIRGFESKEFLLYYQPIFNLQTMDIIGLQAQMQWQHPKYDIVNLAEFLSVAEQSNLIIDMVNWMIQQASLDQKTWSSKNLVPDEVFIKLSSRYFREPKELDNLINLIGKSGIDPKHLALQIPESAISYQEGSSLTMLKNLREMGLHLSFSEFGSGMTNLNLLKTKPVDALVIDQDYLRHVHMSLEDAAFAKTIINIANNMSMQVIAEGIQNQEQLVFLQDHHCSYGYGDFLCQPLTVEELLNLTTTQSAKSLRIVTPKK